MKKAILFLVLHIICSFTLIAQINTDRVMAIGRNALYFEDYVLSIQYFNQVIRSKPWLAEPYFFRAVAKIQLDDYKGAEEDCTLCLERNPFLVQAYFARGIARQSQDDYPGAIQDYQKGLEFRPTDRQMLMNMAVAYIQKKDFDGAETVFGDLIANYPNNSMSYLTRGAMYLEKGDTISALNDYDKSIELDPYYAPAYGNRAIIRYQNKDLDGALADLNEALRLNPRENGFYINRGLVHYQMNDLRGAMEDYDQVISFDSRNLIARFNRGLLRFQVGDNNRAIEDFDVVLQEEPDNFMAYYNRALLKYETGNYLGAIDDINRVLYEYPDFIPGYYTRSEIKRKMRDTKGAEDDYWLAYEIEDRLKKERSTSGNRNNQTSTGTSSGNVEDTDGEEAEDNTREKSDKNINKFNRLVVYDQEEVRRSKYQSEVRGRVQDRNVRVDIEPQFILTYYEKADPIKKIIYYDASLESYNSRMVLPRRLRVTNEEAPLTEDQIQAHFNSIDEFSSKIEENPTNPDYYFGRALDFTLVQDFTEAIEDYTRVIELNPDFFMAFFNRAVVRYKQLDYNLSQGTYDDNAPLATNLTVGGRIATPAADPTTAQVRDNRRAMEHDQIVRDYDRAIQLNPDFVFTYLNRGNLRCAQRDFRAAIQDYTTAIEKDPEFAEAYFNRGLARLSQGDTNRGIADLSKAGELGIVNAYNIIKRMTVN
ncbi:MAG: tetratricopeptide repeat protein [Tannerellaceae bacterium]|nr:tetratricopeptide repeat protein [Tannerellaceae bacterium]